MKVSKRFNEIEAEIGQLEVAFRELLLRGAEALVGRQEACNGSCIHIGPTVIVLIDTSWGWLGPDGRVERISSRFVAVHPKILARFEQIANDNELIGDSKSKASSDQLTISTNEQSLKFVVVVCSAPLLETGFASLTPKAPEEPQQFRPSKLDCHVLLKTLSKWQQRAPERAVLIAHSSAGFAGRGAAKPYRIPYAGHSNIANNVEGNEDEEDDDEEDPRAALVQLAVGRMDRRFTPSRSKLIGELAQADEEEMFFPDGSTVVDKIAGFSSQFDEATLSRQRSYWDVRLHPITPAAYAYAPNHADLVVVKRDLSDISCELVVEPETAVSVSIGPIIGRVSHCSASVLIEISTSKMLELVLVDQLTGAEHRVAAQTTAFKPTVFIFNSLLSRRSYDLFIDGRVSREISTAAHQRDPFVVWGSLTTAHCPGPSSFGPKDSGSLSPFEEAVEEKNLVLQLRQKANKISNNQTHTSQAVEPPVDSHSSNHKRLSCTIFFVGENSPSSRRLQLASTDTEGIEFDATKVAAKSNLADDRAAVLEGLQLVSLLKDMLSMPLNDVEMVIHCGLSVDFRSGHMRAALSCLARAERLLAHRSKLDTISYSHESFGLHKTHMHHSFLGRDYCMFPHVQREFDSLLVAAEQEIRSAYRLHWGTSMGGTLHHGSHLFVSSPMLDLLAAFQLPSLQALASETSMFCANQLLNIVSKLWEEYQGRLWAPEKDVIASTALPYFRQNHLHTYQHCVRQISGGRGLVFTLQICTVFRQEDIFSAATGTNMIPEEQLDLLHHILLHSIDLFPLAMTLVLCSPIPLMDPNTCYQEQSFSNPSSPIYTAQEVLRVLDLLATWLQEDNNREVIIVTGGSSVGFHSSIEITDLVTSIPQPSANQEGNQPSAELSISQICCGPIVGVCGDMFPIGQPVIHSASRKFQFKLRSVHNRSHVGSISLQTQLDGAHRRALIKVLETSQVKEALLQSSRSMHGSEIEAMSYSFDGGGSFGNVWNEVTVSLKKKLGKIGKYEDDKDRFNSDVKGAEQLDSSADSISRAIRASCRRCRCQFDECHVMFKHQISFGLPTHGGAKVQEVFFSICKWVLNRMPVECRSVCPLPSGFIIRRMWHLWCTEYGSSGKREASIGTGDNNGEEDNEEDSENVHRQHHAHNRHHHKHKVTPISNSESCITANLMSEKNFFFGLLSQMIEAQALLEHFAYGHGLMDGWH